MFAMKTIVGFTFTETLIDELTRSGFKFIRNDSTLKNGYYEYLCILNPIADLPQALEIREVVDEVVYFANKNKKDFSPFISELPLDIPAAIHENTVYQVKNILDESMIDGELKFFLKIRKTHSIWALEIGCKDLNKFMKLADSALTFNWNNKKAALIHLGTSCFDLLVTES